MPGPWTFLTAAVVVEIAFATCLKLSNGFERWGIGLLAILLGVISLGLLAMAMRTLPVGTSYAIWTSMGAAGIAVIGIVFQGEPASVIRIAFIATIVIAAVGLYLVE